MFYIHMHCIWCSTLTNHFFFLFRFIFIFMFFVQHSDSDDAEASDDSERERRRKRRSSRSSRHGSRRASQTGSPDENVSVQKQPTQPTIQEKPQAPPQTAAVDLLDFSAPDPAPQQQQTQQTQQTQQNTGGDDWAFGGSNDNGNQQSVSIQVFSIHFMY